MAIATTAATPHPRPCSQHIEQATARLFLEGYGSRFESAGNGTDQAGHVHYRYTIPSETTGSVYQLDFDIVTRVVRCTCKGFSGHGNCKHVELFARTHGLAPTIDVTPMLYRQIQELADRVAELETWLEAVATDMLDRTN